MRAEHDKEVASIRAELAATHAQPEDAHAAKLESLQASHATTLAALKNDHNNQLSALELSLQAANAQVEQDQVKLESVSEERDVLVEQVDRLKIELEGATASASASASADADADVGGKGNEGDSEVEAELKKVKAELQHVSDELAGALEVSTIGPRRPRTTLKCEFCRCRR